MVELALNAARLLGKSRKLAIFGGLVAVAGIVNEVQKHRANDSNPGDEA